MEINNTLCDIEALLETAVLHVMRGIVQRGELYSQSVNAISAQTMPELRLMLADTKPNSTALQAASQREPAIDMLKQAIVLVRGLRLDSRLRGNDVAADKAITAGFPPSRE